MSDSLWPCGLWPASLLCPWGFSKQEYWSGLPCPPPGDLPNPGMEPMFLISSALAGGFFTTSTNWEALLARWVCAESLQSCLALCTPTDCTPPGSSGSGIFLGKVSGDDSECSLNGIFNDSSMCVCGERERERERERDSFSQICFFVFLINTFCLINPLNLSPTPSSSPFPFHHCSPAAPFVYGPAFPLLRLCPGLSFSRVVQVAFVYGHITSITCLWSFCYLFGLLFSVKILSW